MGMSKDKPRVIQGQLLSKDPNWIKVERMRRNLEVHHPLLQQEQWILILSYSMQLSNSLS